MPLSFLQLLPCVRRSGAGRRKLQIDLVGPPRRVSLAGLGQGIAEVEVGYGARRVDLDGVVEPARRFGELVLLEIDEAEIVGGQREIGCSLMACSEPSRATRACRLRRISR